MKQKKKKLPIFYTCELPDIKIKEFSKSQIADIVKYKKEVLMRYKPFFECNCDHPVEVVIDKKINQRKYKIHCSDCKVTKTLVIPKGFDLCLECNGCGGIFVRHNHNDSTKNQLGNYVKMCPNCKNGLTSWVDKILR